MKLHYSHLGGNYPYFTTTSKNLFSTFKQGIKDLEAPITLDILSVYSILTKNYVIGDKTLVEGLNRAPWMNKPDGNGGWEHVNLPKHGFLELPYTEIATQLFSRLKKEVSNYLDGHKTVGILLSGGMDSRVLAGVLKRTIDEYDLKIDVCCFTWGLKDSRDVQYAKRIAKLMKWEMVHVDLGPEDLLDNIKTAATLGAEFSPIHLHGMPKVAQNKNVDVFLAASYGDSIGRGEYSGVHLSKLSSVSETKLNTFGLINPNIEKVLSNEFDSYALAYRSQLPRTKAYQINEIERQSHYLRRQLMAPFDTIAIERPVRQIFTCPESFSFIWSLSPKIRTNRVYSELLKLLSKELLDIPWARTGLVYESKSGNRDNFKKNHNIYGKWLRKDLGSYIERTIKSSSLYDSPLLNKRSVLDKIWIFRNVPATDTCDQLDERIAWLASLALLVRDNNVKISVEKNRSLSKELWTRHRSNVETLGYRVARKFLK